jgi:hypothetical protein
MAESVHSYRRCERILSYSLGSEDGEDPNEFGRPERLETWGSRADGGLTTPLEQVLRGGSGERAQGGEQGLEFLAAVAAAVQVILHQGHRLGRVLPRQRRLDEAVQLLETLVAPDADSPSAIIRFWNRRRASCKSLYSTLRLVPIRRATSSSDMPPIITAVRAWRWRSVSSSAMRRCTISAIICWAARCSGEAARSVSTAGVVSSPSYGAVRSCSETSFQRWRRSSVKATRTAIFWAQVVN